MKTKEEILDKISQFERQDQDHETEAIVTALEWALDMSEHLDNYLEEDSGN